MTYLFNCFVTDVWHEYTSYEVDLEKEETTNISLKVIHAAGMDVICGGSMAPSSKGDFFLFFYGFM